MTRSDIDHYAGLDLWGPYGMADLDRLIGRIETVDAPAVLDVGCGSGALLLRLVETLGGHGTGLDRSEAALALAKQRFATAGHADAATWVHGDVDAFPVAPASHDVAAWLGGPFLGDSHASTVRTFSRMLTPGGWFLLGQGFWSSPPPKAFTDATGIGAGELETEDEMLAPALEAGFVEVDRWHSTTEAWDHFENTIQANHVRYAAAHPDDPAIRRMLHSKQRFHDAQQRWGRTCMGFGVYLLRKES